MTERLRRVVLLAFVLCTPGRLLAHAHLERSEPADGARVSVSPAAIRLWFSEVPELAMTRIVVTGADGHVVATGPVATDAGDDRLVVAPIGVALAPGRYQVRWSTAAGDGHPSRGTFSFTVTGTEAVRQAAAAAVTGDAAPGSLPPPAHGAAPTAMSASSPASIAARAGEFLALIALIGAVVFQRFVAGRATDLDASTRGELARGAAGAGAIAAAALLVVALVRIGVQHRMMTDETGTTMFATMLLESHWGHAILLQLLLAVLALGGFALARGGRAAGWTIATAAALALAITPATAGHAYASPQLRWLAIAADYLHVLGAAGWLGSLLLVAAVAIPVAVRSGDRRWAAVAAVVNVFSPLALACAGTVVVTGLTSAWLRLGTLAALTTTGYGQLLIVKLVVLTGVAATGAYNWLRVRPALGTAVATARLRRSAGIELTIGLAVLIVTAVLVSTPTPIMKP